MNTANPTGQQPVATFDGYVDGWARIKWTGRALPVGTELYAAPAADQHAAGSVEAERAAFEAAYRERHHVPADRAVDFPDVPHAWIWWQARAALDSAKPVAAGELTDEQIDNMWRNSTTVGGDTTQAFVRHFARSIQTLLADSRPAGGVAGYDLECLREQSDAWFAVVEALDKADPGWRSERARHPTGMGCAVAAIEALAASAAQPAASNLRTALQEVLADLRVYTKPINDDGETVANVFAAVIAKADAALSASAVQAGAVPDQLKAIGQLLRTQDNRYTDQPMFIVQQRRRIIGFDADSCDNIVWVCREDDFSEASEEEAAQLEAEYQETGRAKSGWMRTGYVDQWEFVTACFTEQGCKDYLARDGHNLKEPRIYAEGSYRNEEFRTLRNWLMSLAAAPNNTEG